MIGTPPGEAKIQGRMTVAVPPLLIASTKTRVRRLVAAALALPMALVEKYKLRIMAEAERELL
jgi:hypothetical protein